MTLKRGRVTEWAAWTAAFGLGLTGFGEGLRLADLAWSLPVGGALAYAGLPWLTKFRAGAFRLGSRLRR